MRHVALFALSVCALLVAACGGRSPARATDAAGHLFALEHAGRARVVVDGWTPDERVLAAARTGLLERGGLAAAAADDTLAPRCVLATTDSALGRALVERAGFELLESGGFGAFGRTFTGDDDVLRVAFADPDLPGLPLTAFVANRPATLARCAELVEFDVRPRFELRRAGRLVLWGRFASGAVLEGDVDALAAPDAALRSGEILGMAWRAADARAAQAFEPEFAHLIASAGTPPAGWRLVVHADAERYARLLGTLRPVVADPIAREVHRLHLPGARLVSFDQLRLALADGRDLELVLQPHAHQAAASRDVELSGAVLALPREREVLARIGTRFAELAELGADAVVLRHMVALAPDPSHLIAKTWRSAAATSSSLHTDGELWFAAEAARAAGLDVLLEAQFLSAPTSDLAARRKRVDESERIEFENAWVLALEASARRATRVGARALVLGSDLPTITRTVFEDGAAADASPIEHSVREHHASAWALGIRRARAAFGGALVYVARDVSELERAGFVDELDAVCIQHHPELAGVDLGGDARDHAFVGAHRHALERAREAAGERPLLVFGVQCAAARDSTFDPRLPRGPLDEELQAQQLAAFVTALHGVAAPPQGVFLFEWTAEPTRRGGRAHDLARAGLASSLRTLFGAH